MTDPKIIVLYFTQYNTRRIMYNRQGYSEK